MFSVMEVGVKESGLEVCTRNSMKVAGFSKSLLQTFVKHCYKSKAIDFFEVQQGDHNNTKCRKVIVLYHNEIYEKSKCRSPYKKVKVVCRKVSSAPNETVADEPEDAESTVWFWVWIGLGAVGLILFSCIVWHHWRSCMVSF